MRELKYDIAKGIASYFVVLGHLLAQVGGYSINVITFFHMPVFFFISGYFSKDAIQNESLDKFIITKTKALVVPYFIWSGISLLINGLCNIRDIHSFWNEFILIFIYARSVWFLIELFFSMLVFKIIYLLGKKNIWRLMVYCLSGWLILSFFIPGQFLCFYKFKWLFPFFVMGYFYKSFKERMPGKKICRGISYIFPVLACVLGNQSVFTQYIAFEYQNIWQFMLGIVYYVVSLLGIVLILSISSQLANSKVGNIMGDIGKYTIYMCYICFA